MIDLDAHATCPVDPRVLEAMLPFFRERHGNAASDHARGRAAALALDEARAHIAAVAGCAPEEVYFTSGATEANNLAIVGRALAQRGAFVSQPTEHSSVLGALSTAQAMGAAGVMLRVDREGRVDPAELREVLRRGGVGLVSVMHANNEVGTVQPIAELLAACREAGVPLHVDASQAFGRVPLGECPDLLTVSGHKVYGPQGIGALIVRGEGLLRPILAGGSHEGGLRPGTPNLPGAVGLGAAARLLREDPPGPREARTRDALAKRILALPGAVLNGPPLGPGRLPHNLHVTLTGTCPQNLRAELRDRLAVSSASACRGPGSRSHVLDAMGAPGAEQGAPVRFGVTRWTTAEDVAAAAGIVAAAVRKLYGMACEVPR